MNPESINCDKKLNFRSENSSHQKHSDLKMHYESIEKFSAERQYKNSRTAFNESNNKHNNSNFLKNSEKTNHRFQNSSNENQDGFKTKNNVCNEPSKEVDSLIGNVIDLTESMHKRKITDSHGSFKISFTVEKVESKGTSVAPSIPSLSCSSSNESTIYSDVSPSGSSQKLPSSSISSKAPFKLDILPVTDDPSELIRTQISSKECFIPPPIMPSTSTFEFNSNLDTHENSIVLNVSITI